VGRRADAERRAGELGGYGHTGAAGRAPAASSRGSLIALEPVPREGPVGAPVLLGRHEADISDWDAPPRGDRVVSIDKSGEWRVWSTDFWIPARKHAGMTVAAISA